MKPLPIGRDDLKDIIEEGCYYVDKTKIIEELLDSKTYVTLFPRPRRFGKSLMLSTLDQFFNIEQKQANKDLFKGLYIEKSKYKKEQGKYPIIKLNLKSVEADNWEEMYGGIREIIRQLFESKRYVLEILNDDEKALYGKFLSREADLPDYKLSLKILSEYLYRYYNEKVIILIDEYDVPIQKGYTKGFYDEIVNFIKGLFNNALKTNNSIKFAIMTGVLRVSKESIFSDLNNVDVYSVIDSEFSQYFGFTEQETEQILKQSNLELTSEVKKMYDGYVFGDTEIYNPWSVIKYASRKRLYPYWINTSSDELLKDIFNQTRKQTEQMLEDLILGKSVTCKYNDKVTFLDLRKIAKSDAKDTVLNFLLTSGYLTKEKGSELTSSGNIQLKIPNSEVQTIYVEILSKWTRDAADIDNQKLQELQKVLLANEPEKLEEMLNEILNHMSYTEGQEQFYHGYMLGLLVEFLNIDYIVKSNREAGKGRFDIMIESADRKNGIILEFKVAKEDESLEEKAKIGREQILEKEYYKELELDRVENIITYGIAFKGKECKVE